MVRLIQQEPLQAVDRHPLVEPAGDGVDVHQLQLRPRLVMRDDRADHVCAFVAVGQKGRSDGEQAERRTGADESDDSVEKSDGGQAEHQAIDEHDLFNGDAETADVAIERTRQKVRHPVVVQGFVVEERVRRRHIALGEVRRHRHRPDEVGGEVGAVRLAFGHAFAHVSVRGHGHERNDRQRDRDGNRVSPIEHGKSQRRPAEAARGQDQQPGENRPGEDGDPVLNAGGPEQEHPEHAEAEPERRPDQAPGDPGRILRREHPPHQHDTGRDHPGDRRQEHDGARVRNDDENFSEHESRERDEQDARPPGRHGNHLMRHRSNARGEGDGDGY